ncbi:MAG: hypothetical protein LKJ59_09045, partial [Oscillospiraceae bacterium]|nr:hypothetical protein [Oscillospiraceae bacterium]
MLSEQLSRASIPLAHLDDVLRNGGNRNGSSLRVIARYAKGKSAEENAEFLRREYGRGGKGFIFGTERLSVWFDEPGLRVGRGRSALGARDAALVSWEQAADRIGELLTAGQYASRDDLERAPAFERRELAESLWVLHQDTAGEFFLDESLFQGGFPESTERIAALLGQPEQLESVLSGLRGFCAAYEKNPELLRFRIHDPKALSQRLTDLQKQPIVFPAMDLPNPAFERFITEDEIDAFLTRGGPVSDGKYRIFSYFLSGHSVKEQAALLRDEYGTGGSTGALSGADDSYADYSPKGLVLARGPISNPYDKIKLSWSKAAERVSRLIFSGRYMSRAELGRIPDYEKRVLATEIHSFFINLPKKIQRPYEGNAFDSTGIDQVMEKLGNPARVDEILGMMKPVLENTAPDDRSFKIRSAACRHTQEFRDGAFTLFPHLSLVPTPEEGFAAAPAPALSEPDDEQPPEQLSLFPDENQQQYTAIRAESQQAAPNLNVQPTARTGDTIENGVILHHVVLTLSGGQRENAQRTTDSDAISLPYQVGDTVYLDDKPFEITGIGNVDVQLRDPALSYPIFRAESRENFERLLRRDSRNGPMTDFLATDLKHVDADLREALTSGLLGQEDKQTLAGLFRSREGNARVARWLSETCAGTAETMELITGETADFFADTKGFEVEIHDKYNSRRSASWERIAPILRALYQRELDGFSHEPVLREPVAPSTEVKPPEPAAQPSGSPRPENGAPVPEEAAAVSSPGETAAEKPVSVQPKPRNFHITDDNLGVGGAKTKYAYNIAAIRTLKTIEAEGRTATPEEQETLSRYVGWGGLPQAFDKDNADWKKEYAELKDALTDREYESARASTLNAHYTSPTVIRAIYEAVGNFGFQTGNILEPACGVGNFFGLLPESMAASRLYGVELDSITGRIARQLYPNADITLAGFETTDRRDFFDLAVGNVPFGSYKVPDRAYDKLGFPIHDYFFAKTLDQVRPGGVIAFVTSHYTMDKRSPDVRRYLAQRADLLGAIRLPSTAFKANAGTEVTTDIVFLQKRDRPIDIEPDWVHLSQTEDGIPVNSYFADHPEMVLGTVKWDDRMYGDKMETACEAFPG